MVIIYSSVLSVLLLIYYLKDALLSPICLCAKYQVPVHFGIVAALILKGMQ